MKFLLTRGHFHVGEPGGGDGRSGEVVASFGQSFPGELRRKRKKNDTGGVEGVAQALPITSLKSHARFVPLGNLAHRAIPTPFHIRRCEGGGP